MTNREDLDQTAPLHSFISPISPNIYFFYGDNILNILHNIPLKKYYDMVFQGSENISSDFGIL